ncbi:MAG: hypothetical protein PHP17_03140, partial [Candidatus Omnitrophica bacterium]|nr:hypothetical protein [Candidatus Omnitrophota bacterium]
MKTIDKAVKILKFPVFFIFFALLALHASYNLSDVDYFFHTKSGEYIVTHNTIVQHDIFSFTKEGASWTNHEWLFQVITYLFYKNWGLNGFFFLLTFVFFLSFLLLTHIILKKEWIFGFPLLFY